MNKVLVCDLCSKEFNREKQYINHLNRKTPCVYKCSDCNTIFSRKRTLDYHINNNVCDKHKYKCSRCNNVYKTVDDYKEHNLTCNNRITNINMVSMNNAHNTTNNTTNNNSHNTIINNNINITLPGKESLGHISVDRLREMLKKEPMEALLEYLKEVFFNENAKENHKWYITNINNKFGGVEYDHEKNKMNRVDSYELSRKYADISYNHQILALMDIPENELTRKERIKITLLLRKLADEHTDPDFMTEFVTQSKLIGYNNRNLSKETLDKL